VCTRNRQDKRQAAAEHRRPQTDAEAVLWSRLRHNRLRNFHFRRQQILAGFIVDFYCHEARPVVEVDGCVHVDQPEYDRERDSVLAQLDLCVLRFTNDQVLNNLKGVMLKIALAASDRI
jgi:very-short-patch-repair endonuclease